MYPCSQAQLGFWFEDQLHPRNPGLNVAARWRLEGDLDDATLEAAWRKLMARHEALRTHFEVHGGQPIQLVEPQVTISLMCHDLRTLAPDAAAAEADRLAAAEARTPFDLTVGPLLRVSRIVLSETSSLLLLTAHHAVCDGWSVGILARELGEICASLQNGEPVLLPELPMRYGDYAAAEHDRLRDETFAAELATLRESLREFKQFELATDHPRPAVQTYNGAIASRLLDRSITTALGEIARRNGCTLFMASFAALLALFHRYTGETDIALGTQVAGRDDVRHESIVGCFINTVALRGDLSGDPSFNGLLERVGDAAIDAFDLRHVPISRLVQFLKPKRDLSRNTLLSINFSFYAATADARHDRFAITALPSCSAGAVYDLNFAMIEFTDGWRASCEYNADLFDAGTVDDLIKRLELLMRSIIADPEQPISRLSLLSDADRHELIVTANRTAAAYPADRTVVELFSDRVKQTPDAVAVVCGAASLTYAQVDAASNRLARELISRELGHGKLVGIMLERSPELIVALLAVLKAGSAYVPLDPLYPAQRLGFIIENSRLPALISRSTLCARVDARSTCLVRVDADAPAIERNAAEPLETIAAPNELAYVIYTSGSTGWPKGVQIEHRALVNLLCAMAVAPGITADDVLVAVTTISFDIAALEMFLPLISGARLVIADEAEMIDAAALLRLIRTSGGTVMQATPITWQMLIESDWLGDPPLTMLCGGEALSRTLADQLLVRGSDLWNMYGPTETTIWSSAARVTPGTGPVPVGGPIANTQFYVLDAHGELVPPGVAGELFIGGDGVARGYFDRPDLTAERFLPDPFRGVDGAKIYRTGDVVRRRGSGSLEFLGRSDQQIKVRGLRIELGEIEAALLRQPDVAQAVALVRGDAVEKTLWAFVVASARLQTPHEAWTADLRLRLSEILPQYMVPAPIVVLDALPRTPNGKIDRNALPTTVDGGAATPDDAPANPTELTLAGLIGELLGQVSIGRNDDMFARGMQSHLGIRLIDRIEQKMGVRLPLRDLYDAQTVALLAKRVTSAQRSDFNPSEPTTMVTHNPRGSRTAFHYFHNDLLADGIYVRRLAATLGGRQPIHAIAPHGTAGLAPLSTIAEMARDHLPRILALQPTGPYRLGGFCGGGLVAYEIAQLLQARGESVERLVLVNASPLSTQPNAVVDRLIRAVALNPRLPPRLRETFCHNLIRVGETLGGSPRDILFFFPDRIRAALNHAKRDARPDLANQETFEELFGIRDVETYFANLAASLTYHPAAYDGDLCLLWSTDQRFAPAAASAKWTWQARKIQLIPLRGAHLAPLRDGVEDLGLALRDVLA